MGRQKQWTGDDIRAFRKEYGLSMEAFCRLLRIEPENERTVRRWQDKTHSVPGPVAAFLDVLRRSPEARKAAGLNNLKKQYPYVSPGRPPKGD